MSTREESFPLVPQGGPEGAQWHVLVSSEDTTEEEEESVSVVSSDSTEEEEKMADQVLWKRHYTFSCGGLSHITGKVQMCGLTCMEDFIELAVADA